MFQKFLHFCNFIVGKEILSIFYVTFKWGNSSDQEHCPEKLFWLSISLVAKIFINFAQPDCVKEVKVRTNLLLAHRIHILFCFLNKISLSTALNFLLISGYIATTNLLLSCHFQELNYAILVFSLNENLDWFSLKTQNFI